MCGKKYEEIAIGDCESVTVVVSDDKVVQFADITGDENPIHLNEDYARKSVFGERIAHGLLTAALISAVLGTKLPGPGAVYISQNLKFMAPVKIGDKVTAIVEVVGKKDDKKRVTLKTNCFNNEGKAVIIGEAVMLVPRA